MKYASDLLPESFLQQYVNKEIPWGFNGLGYVVYKRTYSRLIEGTNQTEEWWQTVARCINGAQEIGADYTREEAQRLYDLIFNLKCNFAGRMLWQLGTDTVKKFGLPSLCNCWYVSITEPEDFCFIFEHLMLGGGVGYSIRREHIHELPKVKANVIITNKNTKDADFIVPDSREGWVELLRKVLNAYFVTGKSFSYSTILVRGSGEAIKSFGGVASGPKYLIEMVENVSSVFNKRQGKKLRSIDVLDICNIVGVCVVSGNVRRSAELAIGDPDDYHYLRAKNWSLGNIPNWRAMSNNSIDADTFDHISNEVWDNGYTIDKSTGYAKGEPYGFVNMALARKKGRTKDNNSPDNCEGFNPCAEAQLESYEPCDLAELYLNNLTSKEEMLECAKLLYKTQKAVLTLPSISEKTVKVVKRNMRVGLGVTGICQAMDKLEWLDPVYRELKAFDKEWSKTKGWNESVRLTVIKPSGTLSILSGSTPGGHPGYSQFFIRRVRMASSDKLVNYCREKGYKVEYVKNFDNTENHDTVVVEFPCCFTKETIISKNMTAVEQLELVKKLQSDWADQSVSVTIYYRQNELNDIKEWLKNNYKNHIKTVSFLLHNEHGFTQAPYEEISEEDYQKLIQKVKPITPINVGHGEIESMECEGGVCPVK